MIIHFILVLLIAAATPQAYAQIPSGKHHGEEEILRAWHSEEDIMLSMSMSMGESGKISKMPLEAEDILYSVRYYIEDETAKISAVLENPLPPGTCLPFNDADKTRCDELLNCLEVIIGSPIDFCGVAKDNVCNALLYIYQGDEGVTAICNAAALFFTGPPSPGPYYVEKETTIFDAPQCKPKATVTVPDDSGDNTRYDTLMLTIKDRFLTNGKRSRSNDDRVSDHLIGQQAAVQALNLVEICNNEPFNFFHSERAPLLK